MFIDQSLPRTRRLPGTALARKNLSATRFHASFCATFMQADPLGYEDGPNLYSYVGGDPVNGKDPDGAACVPINSGSAYCRRADMYAQWDREVGHKTRFFAAASATMGVFGNLSLFPAMYAIASSQTRGHMGAISSHLERQNRQLFAEARVSGLPSRSLDAVLVNREQSAVQGYLNGLQQRDPEGYASFVGEVNTMLNRGPGFGYKSDNVYLGVVDQVREKLGGKLDFANQTHREAIGRGLISYIRQSGGCDIAGSRIRSC